MGMTHTCFQCGVLGKATRTGHGKAGPNTRVGNQNLERAGPASFWGKLATREASIGGWRKQDSGE